MLSDALRCSQMPPNAFKYFICFHLSDAVRCLHMLSDAFIYSQILPDPLISFGSLPNPPDALRCHGAACFLPLWVRGRVVCKMSRPFSHCASVRARKHLACKSTQIHANVLRCVYTLSLIFICAHMLSDAHVCSHIRSYALRCSQTSSNPMRCLRISPDPLECRGTACFLPLWVRGRVVCAISRPFGHCASVRARKHLARKSSHIHANVPRCVHTLSLIFICAQML